MLSKMYKILIRFLTILNPKWNVEVTYKHMIGRKINLENPIGFNEKINWLKLYSYPNNNLVIRCTDKVKVREYIVNLGLGHILNEVYQVCDKPEDINFNKLPNQYVVKWNNDCGSTIICSDQSDKKDIVKKLNCFQKRNFFLDTAELHYKKIKPQVMVEHFLKDSAHKEPIDYKIYCYDGIPKFIMVCVDRQFGKVKYYFFDTNWNFLRINNDGKKAPVNFDFPRPDCLEEMLNYSKIITKGFRFVRNDFYVINGKPIFGEMTFTPAAGLDGSLDKKLDYFLGNDLIL